MGFPGKGVQSLACETSNKKSKEENREETELDKSRNLNGEQLMRRILSPVKTTIEKPEMKEEEEEKQSREAVEEEEEEFTTPKAERFRIPPPRECPPAPKPKRRISFFTSRGNN